MTKGTQRMSPMRFALPYVAMLALLAVHTPAEGDDGLVVVPTAEDDALVFPPGESAVLTLRTVNRTWDDLRVVAAVRDFRGVPVKDKAGHDQAGQTVVAFGVRDHYRIETLPGATRARSEADVKAQTEGPVSIELGVMPEGFHMLDLTLFRGGEQVSRRSYPLGVFTVPSPGPIEKPALPIGVYAKFMNFRRGQPEVFWKTYVHAIAHNLRTHHINTILAAGRFAEGELEIYNRYGIVGLSRFGHDLDHSGVIGSFIGDEPKPGPELAELRKKYEALQARIDKIITTCMIGEDMGMTTPQDPIKLWEHLQPDVRVFRWYGLKKSFYGVLNHVHYKGMLPYTSVLRLAEVSGDTPWWIVLPSFGGDQHEAYYQNPSPAQIRSMAHLACAYGADGLVYYLYQTGLVDPVTLKPRDGKFAALADVAGKLTAHADKLAAMKHAGLDVRCPDPVVQAVPVQIAGHGLGVYAVNKDPANNVATRLMLWDDVWHWATARDVFAGRELEVRRGEDGYLFVPSELAPGEGRLSLTDARVDKE